MTGKFYLEDANTIEIACDIRMSTRAIERCLEHFKKVGQDLPLKIDQAKFVVDQIDAERLTALRALGFKYVVVSKDTDARTTQEKRIL